MPTYLYCLARPPRDAGHSVDPSSGARGIDDGAIRILPLPTDLGMAPGLAALVGSMAEAPAITAAHISVHDRVSTAALAAGCDVVPARFGQMFVSDEALLDDVSRRAAVLAPIWQRIAGAVEMSLMIAMPHIQGGGVADRFGVPGDPKATSTGIGYAYMAELARPVRERRVLREQIEPFRMEVGREANTMIRDEAIRLQLDPSVVTLSHLIDRHSVSDYRHHVDRAIRALSGMRVLVSGPHAPYSFVSFESRAT